PYALGKRGNVTLTGYVADTRQLFHAENTILAAPLFSGTGQRVKLLEAFAMGSPVITTTIGAFGFPIVNGVHAIIADTPTEFRAGLKALAASGDLRLRMKNAARQMILDRFTWEAIGRQFFELVNEGTNSSQIAEFRGD